jgi:hypothetical protein
MTPTRRDVFKFAGGAAVGALFTPAPWRLVTDAALWSETWPGVPRNARGEIRARYTNCSLCGAGCAMRVRCVGDQPVSLMGVAAHPFTRGALCPFGLAAHHLPYHPARLKQGPVQDAQAASRRSIAACSSGERVALLDLRPHRTASWTYRRALAKLPGGTYLAAPGTFAVNLAAAKTVVSFGLPMLDGWGTPGNVFAQRDNFKLIQVESLESRTASLADEWITDAAKAREIALAQPQPTVVLDSQNRPEILALNELTASLGTVLVARRETPVPKSWDNAAPITALDAIPDRSLRVLFIDESAPGSYIPWSAIERKLVADNPLVVAFSSTSEGYSRHAQFTLPTAVFPETLDDIPTAIDSPAAMFRLSAALVAPPAGMVNPAGFVSDLAGIDATNALQERAAAIYEAKRGTLFTPADGNSTPLQDVKPADFWKALNEGATWTDSLPARAEAPQLAFASTAAPATEDDLPLAVVLTESLAFPGSPILTKLYQESNLRLAAGQAALHPSCGIPDGAGAVLQTRCGKLSVRIVCDPGIPPGIVQLAAGPRMLDLCGASPRAKVVRV